MLIEQLSSLDGNSKREASWIKFLETDPQKKSKIDDNYHLFFNDTLKSGKNLNDPQLLDTFSKGKKYLYDYYISIFGLEIRLIGQLGGHSVSRTHRPTDSKFVIGYKNAERAAVLMRKLKYTNVLDNLAHYSEKIFNERCRINDWRLVD